MQAVILAGGLGTRIRREARGLPKGLIPIHGIPFLLYQLAWLYKNHIKSIVILTGYGAEQISNTVGNSYRNIPIWYSEEVGTLLGTAGALRLAADRGLLQERFIILYGDSYLPVELSQFIMSSISANYSVMGVLKNNNLWDRSNVVYHNGLVELYDKQEVDPIKIGMQYIDYGISCLKRDVVFDNVIAGTSCDLAPIFKSLSIKGRLYGFEFQDRFYEIGSPTGLIDFKKYVSLNPHVLPS